MSLIVHGAGYSTCTQRILTTLCELDVEDWKLEFVDMLKGVHKSPEHLAMQVCGCWWESCVRSSNACWLGFD